MIKNIKHIVTAMMLFSSTAMAASSSARQETKQESVGSNQLQAVIGEYKAYLAATPKETREEILAYRSEMEKINKAKRELYKKLSQEAQGFLVKEQEFKKKLPIKQRGQININKLEKRDGSNQ